MTSTKPRNHWCLSCGNPLTEDSTDLCLPCEHVEATDHLPQHARKVFCTEHRCEHRADEFDSYCRTEPQR